MPLYLVRWPRLEASLVRASCEEELADVLDEVGDPGATSFCKFTGPLYLDVDLGLRVDRNDPATPLPRDLSSATRLALGVPEADHAHAMVDAIVRHAFPAVARAIARADDDGRVEDAVMRAAVLEELAAGRTLAEQAHARARGRMRRFRDPTPWLTAMVRAR